MQNKDKAMTIEQGLKAAGEPQDRRSGNLYGEEKNGRSRLPIPGGQKPIYPHKTGLSVKSNTSWSGNMI